MALMFQTLNKMMVSTNRVINMMKARVEEVVMALKGRMSVGGGVLVNEDPPGALELVGSKKEARDAGLRMILIKQSRNTITCRSKSRIWADLRFL